MSYKIVYQPWAATLAGFALASTAHAARIDDSVARQLLPSSEIASQLQSEQRSPGKRSQNKRQLPPITLKTSTSESALLGDGYIRIIAAIAPGASEIQARSELQQAGARRISVAGTAINAELPVSALQQVHSFSSVSDVAADRPFNATAAGAVTSQGVARVRADQARTNLGTQGAGVKVCIVSDSFATLPAIPGRPDAAADIRSGDLPGVGNPFGRSTPVEIIEEGPARIDEGRAMAQIVHDIAPAATLAFGSWFAGSQARHVQLLDQLAARNCNVITDDTVSFRQPFLRDGIVAQKIDELVGRGIHYVISAGNFGSRGFTQGYRPGPVQTLSRLTNGTTIGNYELHNFNPNPNGAPDYFQQLSPNGDFRPLLQWNDRHLSEGQAGGATTEVDVFLSISPSVDGIVYAGTGLASAAPLVFFEGTDSAGDTIFIVSARGGDNVGNDPLEGFETLIFDAQFNLVSRQDGVIDLGIPLYLIVGRRAESPGNPGHLRWIDASTSLPVNGIEYLTANNAQTLIASSNAARAVTVAAARYDTINLANAASPATLQSFSSRGGTPLFYDAQGNLLSTPIVRRKPELTGPDGADTTFFSLSSGDFDNTGVPNFFGTSASAPHLAGIAALLLAATNRQPTPDTLRAFLQATAKPVPDAEVGVPASFNARGGAGIVDAVAAATAVTTDPVSVRFPFDAGALIGNGRPFALSAGSTIARVTVSGYGGAVTVDRRTEGAQYLIDPSPVTIFPGQTERTVFISANGRSTDGRSTASNTQNASVTNLGFISPQNGQTVNAGSVAFSVASNEAVVRVDYQLGGSTIASSTQAADGFRASANLSAGARTINAVARSASGSILFTRSITITVR